MKKLLPVLFLAGCATSPPVDTTGWTYVPHDLTPQQRSVVERTISAELKDPESARFSRYKARKVLMPGKREAIQVCVFVNAKNSFGGYTGATPYMGVFPQDDLTQFRITSWRDPQLAQAVAEGCAQMGLLASN